MSRPVRSWFVLACLCALTMCLAIGCESAGDPSNQDLLTPKQRRAKELADAKKAKQREKDKAKKRLGTMESKTISSGLVIYAWPDDGKMDKEFEFEAKVADNIGVYVQGTKTDSGTVIFRDHDGKGNTNSTLDYDEHENAPRFLVPTDPETITIVTKEGEVWGTIVVTE